MSKLTRIQTPTEGYERHYPKIVELANKQLEEQLWFSSEMEVKLDRMSLLYQLTPEQTHAVKTVLSSFVRYELMVGEMWKRVAEVFPRPEVQLAASVVEMVERAIHAEFYNQINVQLGIDKDENYLEFKNDKVLNERAKWFGDVLSGEDKILSVIIFSLTETALLFSPFSILKSFQSNGMNELSVIVRGTNQSAIDEDLHGQISAEIINTYYHELGTTLFEDKTRYAKVIEAVHKAFEHEQQITRKAIPSGSLNGNTVEQFDTFVKYRLNIYLERLGLPPEFEIDENPIADWFEKNTYAFKVVDFFTAGQGMEYESSWNTEAFKSAWLIKGDV